LTFTIKYVYIQNKTQTVLTKNSTTMKNTMKIAVTLCLCLILWEGYGQSNLPSNDDMYGNEFVCFSYDGRNANSPFVTKTISPLLIDTHYGKIIKRSSMEDIMLEQMENDATNYLTTKKEYPAILAPSKN